jgi:hypothetical protein
LSASTPTSPSSPRSDRTAAQTARSTARLGAADEHWAVITSRWPLTAVAADTATLALAIIDSPVGAVVVACSVLQWRSAAAHWPDRPGADPAFAARVATTIDEHTTAIRTTLTSANCDVLIWGGDFNQELTRPIGTGSVAGIALLTDAVDRLGVTFATTAEPALQIGSPAIDHVALPPSWRRSVTTETPLRRGARRLVAASDHALTTVDAAPSR